MRMVLRPLARISAVALAPAALCLALAGCASTNSASAASAVSASPTPTCPPTTQTASFKIVSGKITSFTGGTLTVAPTSGAAVTVQVTSTTRITKLAPATVSAIQAGDVAQITADASGVIATRITVARGAGGFRGAGAGNGGQPNATRTPGARFNPACFRRTPQAGGGFGGAGGQADRVTSVSSTQIVVTDAQGESLTYSVTPNTVIIAPTSGSASDLVVGATVTATGAASGSAIAARAITITPAGQ